MATTSRSSRLSPADADHRAAPARAEVVPAIRATGLLELVGDTPLLEIRRLTRGLLRPSVKIFAKLEGFNPGGSVKDRAAKKMIEAGHRT